MENTYVTKTTNTVTMNKDSARLKHNHRDVETIKRELEKDPSRSFGDISKAYTSSMASTRHATQSILTSI